MKPVCLPVFHHCPLKVAGFISRQNTMPLQAESTPLGDWRACVCVPASRQLLVHTHAVCAYVFASVCMISEYICASEWMCVLLWPADVIVVKEMWNIWILLCGGSGIDPSRWIAVHGRKDGSWPGELFCSEWLRWIKETHSIFWCLSCLLFTESYFQLIQAMSEMVKPTMRTHLKGRPFSLVCSNILSHYWDFVDLWN
jgi:hypothetical protein